jgi:hypothetical protein
MMTPWQTETSSKKAPEGQTETPEEQTETRTYLKIA